MSLNNFVHSLTNRCAAGLRGVLDDSSSGGLDVAILRPAVLSSSVHLLREKEVVMNVLLSWSRKMVL